MRVTMTYGGSNTVVNVTRMLDGRRKRLVVSCPYQMAPGEVLTRCLPMLTDDEAVELAEALGLDQPPSTA